MLLNEGTLQSIKREYEEFRKTDDYHYSEKRKKFVSSIARPILSKLLSKESISTNDLKVLLEIFKENCKVPTFAEKLRSLNLEVPFTEEIIKIFADSDLKGYTRLYFHDINLSKEESQKQIFLNDIFNFLKGVFNSTSKDEIKQIILDFDNKDIPSVRYGTYSPWLHYMHPEICPIVNGPVVTFLEGKGVKINTYTEAWGYLEEINQIIGDSKDYGDIDHFIFTNVERGKLKKEESKKKRRNEGELEDDKKRNFENYLLLSKKQIILYGPPGTGKTFKTKEYSSSFIKTTFGERNS